MGDKQGQTAGLTEGQQAEIEPQAAGKSKRIPEEGEPFDSVTLVHDMLGFGGQGNVLFPTGVLKKEGLKEGSRT